MKPKIEVVLSDERLITPSGLCMVGQVFGKSQAACGLHRSSGLKAALLHYVSHFHTLFG